MTPEEWQRVRPILEFALELESAKRPAYLDGACADPSLRHEVESLIAVHEQAGTGFLNSAAVPGFVPPDEARFRLLPGKRMGAYEILEEIAQGGMGAVYRAIRADGQYRQQVALKIVRADLGAELTATRFRNERQILASLDHPNIAKILDGGTTADGLPYFVMELIDGLPITDYCDRHKLSIDARLTIFRAVCSAVHYAHQHLVIHRDIKPTNILITAEGVPKLLDFGIAKILDPNLLPENVTMTAVGLWMMTPEYASPEQFRGEAITTATDVYSLGLVLYELLTGHRAYRFPSRMPHEIARSVLETEPDKPSTVIRRKEEAAPTPELVSSLRADSPEKLHRRLVGDLDNIVLKAIRKEPRERYNSADQLFEDIRRHLDALPVLARTGTVAYRCRKYVLRHKVGVAAATLVFLSLLTGIVLTMREARIARANQLRAEQRFNDVRTLANSLMFDIHDSIKDLPGATPARKLLVQRALKYLDSLATEAGSDPSLQRELAVAYERIGDVQGHPFNANLGDMAGALVSYRKALAIRESLAKSNGNREEDQLGLSNDFERVGLCLQGSGDYNGALENFRKAFALFEHIAAMNPSPESKERLAGGYFTIAQCQADLGDFAGALGNYRQSAAIREAITGDSRSLHARIQMRLAGVYAYMSQILEHREDHERAIEMQRKAGVILSNLSASDPTNAAYREYLNENHYWTGVHLQRKGDLTQASLSYRQALAGFAALSLADPKEFRARRFAALCDVSIGTLLSAKGRTIQALNSIRKGLAILEELTSSKPSEDVATAYGAIGLVYSRAAETTTTSEAARIADWQEARSAYRKSLDNWLEVKRRGALTGFNAAEPEKIAGKLAKCDDALAKLGASTR